MSLLLSYPRSGNTWIRYCVESITKQPTGYPGSKNPGDNAVGEVLDTGADISKPSILVKAHRLRHEHLNCEPLVFVIRNYKEVIPRNLSAGGGKLTMANFKKTFDDNTVGMSHNGVDYISCIQSYELCSVDKMFIYYEDLLDKPRPTISSIIDFLGYGSCDLGAFFDKYEWHRERGIRAYHDRSFTRGKNTIHHSHRLSDELKSYMDRRLKNQFPHLFEKYLKRYQEG